MQQPAQNKMNKCWKLNYLTIALNSMSSSSAPKQKDKTAAYRRYALPHLDANLFNSAYIGRVMRRSLFKVNTNTL